MRPQHIRLGMMSRTIRAEWLKAVHNPALIRLAVGCIVVAIVFPVAITLFGVMTPASGSLSAAALSWPRSLSAGVVFLRNFGPVLAVIVFASIFGLDYESGMWDWILSRDTGRFKWFAAKLVASLGFCTAVAVASLCLWLSLAGLGAWWLGGSPITPPPPKSYGALFVMPVGLMIFYGVTAMLATVAWRSTVVGITAGLLVPTLVGFAAFRSKSAVMPLAHLREIQLILLGASDNESALFFRIGMVCLQAGVILGLGVYIFSRQEFTAARG